MRKLLFVLAILAGCGKVTSRLPATLPDSGAVDVPSDVTAVDVGADVTLAEAVTK